MVALITRGPRVIQGMSPTVLRVDGFRFYFYSREESRPHVHVQHADGEAKIWLEPGVELARAWGLKPRETAIAIGLATEHRNVLLEAWYRRTEG